MATRGHISGVVRSCRLTARVVALMMLMGTGASAQVFYRDGLKAAVARNDIAACDTIDQHEKLMVEGIDFGTSPEQWRVVCKMEFAAVRRDPGLCETLSKVPASGVSQRDTCVSYVAWATRRPELCESIQAADYPDSRVDVCREGSIYEIKQCSEGFRGRVPDAQRCIDKVAENRRELSVCRLHKSAGRRRSCEMAVKHAQAKDLQLRLAPAAK